VVVLLASAARRLLGVATALLRGSAQSRESLTQDSRSTVKARLIDPLRESFGEGRCTPRGDDVAASQEAVTWVGALGHAKHRGLHSATTVICAYVTSGDPLVTTRARSVVPARNDLTPRRAASSRLAAHEGRTAIAQHAPHAGGALGVGLGEWPATPALFWRRPAAQVATLRGRG